MAKNKISLDLLGELITRYHDELRELAASIGDEQRAQREVLQTLQRMLRRIEERLDRSEEQQLALMRDDQALERRMRALERLREDQP
jgi:hypothetical protein